jgi:hypothetical protein
MSKNILVEELRRIHEMMGIKPKSILVEQRLPKSRSFDLINMNPAIKSEIENSIVDWANNTVGLTKNGGRTTISDLIELGKKYAREAGDDVTDSNALYYLAAKSGRNNFIDIVNRISSKIQKQAQQEFTNKLSSLTDTYTKDQLQGLLARNSSDLSGLDAAEIQALSNNLRSLKDNIDNSTLDSSLKTDLKKMVDDQIDTYETAAAKIYVSNTRVLPREIGDASATAGTTASSAAEQKWATAKAKAQASLGKQIDESDPVVQDIKRTVETSTDEQLANMLSNYVTNQQRILREGTAAEKEAARQNLNNFGKNLESASGGAYKAGEKGVHGAGKMLVWIGKNWKLLTMGTLATIMFLQLPDILELGKDVGDMINTYRAEYECWENVTNFEDYLDWEWWPGGANQLAEFIMAQFKSDELLEYVCDGGISAVYYSEIKTGSWKGGYEIRFEHSDGCTDSLEIQITDGEFSGTRWKDNKRCNEGADTEVIDTGGGEEESTGGKFDNTFEGFEKWGQSQTPKLTNSDGSIYWDEESTQGFIKDSSDEYQAVNYSDGTFDNPLD